MSIDEKLAAKMVAVIRDAAKADWVEPAPKYIRDARELAPLLPDPDLMAAKSIAMSILYDGMGSADHFQGVFTKAALLGIRHGRANP